MATKYIEFDVAAQLAGDATATLAVVLFDDYRGVLDSAQFLPAAASVGDNANRHEWQIQLADGTDLFTLDHVTGVNLVANVPKDIPVSGSLAERTVKSGDALVFSSILKNAGNALPLGTVRIGYHVF